MEEAKYIDQRDELICNKNDNQLDLTDNDIQKNILVLVNPHSGRGKSLKIYSKRIKPFLDSRNIAHEVFVTKSDYRIQDYFKKKNIEAFENIRSILVVSGDGLLHETVNAIMNRPDWRQIIEIPIGIVPTGSGNGLAYTLIHQSKQSNIDTRSKAIEFCCQQAIQGKVCHSDLVRIKFGQGAIIWSFLSIGWGLMADIDVDSDWLRWIGEYRFTVYGLLRSITSKSLRGKLSYKHSDDWVEIEDEFACIYAAHQSYLSRVTNFAPKSTLTDQLIYLTFIRGKLSPCRVIEYLLAIEDGSHDKLPYVQVVPTSSFILQPLDPSKIVVDGEIIPWTLTDGPIVADIRPEALKLCWCSGN